MAQRSDYKPFFGRGNAESLIDALDLQRFANGVEMKQESDLASAACRGLLEAGTDLRKQNSKLIVVPEPRPEPHNVAGHVEGDPLEDPPDLAEEDLEETEDDDCKACFLKHPGLCKMRDAAFFKLALLAAKRMNTFFAALPKKTVLGSVWVVEATSGDVCIRRLHLVLAFISSQPRVAVFLNSELYGEESPYACDLYLTTAGH